MLALVLAVRFTLEVALLAVLAWWGWEIGGGGWLGATVGAVLAVGAAVVWGLAVSPRARLTLSAPGRIGIELALFVVAGFALVWLGYSQWAAAIVLADLVVVGALALLGRSGEGRAPSEVQRRMLPRELR